MKVKNYETEALSTAIYPQEQNILYPTLGLTGEAGEVSDKVKKVLRDNNGIFTDEIKKELAKELGDVAWYIVALSRDLGYSLEDVLQMNIDKLSSRKNRGVLSGSGDNR